ncbi:unnamed protein product [Linum trigynum]|uniref:Alpha 1,4-glycosyltransferase domain-containing protein n=1 Tax=Linum trigynum TaxID=586398 RepID=A0AAV2FC93_9ROSI
MTYWDRRAKEFSPICFEVVVLWSLVGLRNSIDAHTFDVGMGKWSRLNNVVLIFDRNHPLVYRFIEEFARTFEGNKWGHNNDMYLGSRVGERVVDAGDSGFNFMVKSLAVFHPVDWSRILALFHGRGVGFMRGG